MAGSGVTPDGAPGGAARVRGLQASSVDSPPQNWTNRQSPWPQYGRRPPRAGERQHPPRIEGAGRFRAAARRRALRGLAPGERAHATKRTHALRFARRRPPRAPCPAKRSRPVATHPDATRSSARRLHRRGVSVGGRGLERPSTTLRRIAGVNSSRAARRNAREPPPRTGPTLSVPVLTLARAGRRQRRRARPHRAAGARWAPESGPRRTAVQTAGPPGCRRRERRSSAPPGTRRCAPWVVRGRAPGRSPGAGGEGA